MRSTFVGARECLAVALLCSLIGAAPRDPFSFDLGPVYNASTSNTVALNGAYSRALLVAENEALRPGSGCLKVGDLPHYRVVVTANDTFYLVFIRGAQSFRSRVCGPYCGRMYWVRKDTFRIARSLNTGG